MSRAVSEQAAGPSAFSAYASRFLTGKGAAGRGGSGDKGSQVGSSTILTATEISYSSPAPRSFTDSTKLITQGILSTALPCSALSGTGR